MIRIEPSRLRDEAIVAVRFQPAHVTTPCFGEAGMHDRPERTTCRPIAAGLFGVASEAAPPLLTRGVAGRA